jgi:lycopene cyclase domain-containing protein
VSYTTAALLGVLVAALVDLVLLRTGLLRRRAFWVAYTIVLFFQLIVNGLLTGLKIVRYDRDAILGLRIAYAPVEDLFFGFAMVLVTPRLWVWAGRRAGPPTPREGRPGRPTRAGSARPGPGD